MPKSIRSHLFNNFDELQDKKRAKQRMNIKKYSHYLENCHEFMPFKAKFGIF